jgi:hypothetical protein
MCLLHQGHATVKQIPPEFNAAYVESMTVFQSYTPGMTNTTRRRQPQIRN